MPGSDDSTRNEGREGGDPVRGRGRGCYDGRGCPQHGFVQGGGSPTRTWGGSPYHIPRSGIDRPISMF
jgi:hypothetical protein